MANNEPVLGNAANDNSEPSSRSSSGEAGRLGRGLESLIPPNHSASNTPVQHSGQVGQAEAHPASDVSGASHATSTSSGQAASQTPMHQEPAETNHDEPARLAIDNAPRELSRPSATPTAHDALPGVSAEELAARPARRIQDPDGGTAKKYADAVFHIETDKIVPNPDQPRRNFDTESLKELAASIREFGLLQPLVVTKVERDVPTGTEIEYQLISGERRLMAAKMLGLPRVPAVIRNLTYNREGLELAVIENIQRENLNPIELARAYARLQDEFRLTQREVASRLGKSRETVANTVRLLDLPANIQEAIQENQISESHGRLLLTIDDIGLQQKLFRDLLENRMTTRELQSRARAGQPKKKNRGGEESPPGEGLSPELRFLQEKLSSDLGAPVSIHQSGSSGRITINFYSNEELQHILDKLGSEGPGA